MGGKKYNLEEAIELWRQEPDDNVVFKAATEDLEEYPLEIQAVIKEEAERRRKIKKAPEEFCMDLKKANIAIDSAWEAGVISGSLTLIVSIIAAFGYSFAGASIWGLLDAFLIFGLTYGIYKKNRACAIILFVYWFFYKIISLSKIYICAGGLIYIIFCYFFFLGIRGTFAYHKIVKSGKGADEESAELRSQSYG